jgi:hypothetical protein
MTPSNNNARRSGVDVMLVVGLVLSLVTVIALGAVALAVAQIVESRWSARADACRHQGGPTF